MAYFAHSGGQDHRVEVRHEKDGCYVRLDNREFQVDFLQVDPGLYSLLIGGRSYEIDLLEMDEGFVVC